MHELRRAFFYSRFEAENGGADGGGGNEDTSNGNMQSQIEAMLANTRKQIEERRKQTQALLVIHQGVLRCLVSFDATVVKVYSEIFSEVMAVVPTCVVEMRF